MAKIIQFDGWYQTGGTIIKMYLNADHIRTINREIKGNNVTTVIYTESYRSSSNEPPIYTNLDIDELAKLINE